MNTKTRLCTLMADMGLIPKVRTGRTDELVSLEAEWPAVVAAAVDDAGRRYLTKGSREWRQVEAYIIDGVVPGVRKTRSKTSQHNAQPARRLTRRLEYQLICAGRDLVDDRGSDSGDTGRLREELFNCASDMARGVLLTNGIDPDASMLSAAADYVAQGIEDQIRRIVKAAG